MRPAGPPDRTPLGLLLAQTAKATSRAFESHLAEAGGSLPMWLVLLALIRGETPSQSDLAARIGVQGPTLTHHLNRMEEAGLVRRERRADNRRVHDVTLTDEGRAMFHRLRGAAMAFDAQLRAALTPEEAERLRGMLARLAAAADPDTDASAGG